MTKSGLETKISHPIFLRLFEKSKQAIAEDKTIDQQLRIKFGALGFVDESALSQRVRLEKDVISYTKACLSAKEQAPEKLKIKATFNKKSFVFCLMDQWQQNKDGINKRLISALTETYPSLGDEIALTLDLGFDIHKIVFGTARVQIIQGSFQALVDKAYNVGASLGEKIVDEQLGNTGFNEQEISELHSLSNGYAQSYGDFFKNLVPGGSEQARGILWDQSQLLKYLKLAQSIEVLKNKKSTQIEFSELEHKIKRFDRKINQQQVLRLYTAKFLTELGV